MTTTASQANPALSARPDPMLRERCDHCGQRAYVVIVVRVNAAELPLSWCAHHYAQAEAKLKAGGTRVLVDRRTELS